MARIGRCVPSDWELYIVVVEKAVLVVVDRPSASDIFGMLKYA